MTIKTLTFIHSLLIEEESEKAAELRRLHDVKELAEDMDADNLGAIQDGYNLVHEQWSNALAALVEFEEHEWR